MNKAEEDHYKRLIDSLGKWGKLMHPEYGPCDGFADGMCSECWKIVKDGRAAMKYAAPYGWKPKILEKVGE